MLTQLRQYMINADHPTLLADSLEKPAAVLVAITDEPNDPKVILTRRADTLSSHSGEVSLPGGKWELEDPSLEHTALREAEEEIGLNPEQVEVLGPLPMLQTWRGVNVAPYVGVVPRNLIHTPNPGELDAIFEVPVRFFLSDQRIRTDVFQRSIGHTWSPAYQFEDYEIWGFTARLLISLFNDALGSNIERDNVAPIKDWGTINSLI